MTKMMTKFSSKQLALTLNLPKTNFPRKNSPQISPKLLNDISTNMMRLNHERLSEKLFTIHDGPPFANGDLHIGHAFNKLVKDIILRYKFSRGYKIRYVSSLFWLIIVGF